MTDTQPLSSKYPYTATMVDNSGEEVLFWVSAHNRAHLCNTNPIVNINIDEKRLTPRNFKFRVVSVKP